MYQMMCPSEEDWDVFLLSAETDRSSDLGSHLGNCQMCQVTVQRRRVVLGMLKRATEEATCEAHRIRHFRPMIGGAQYGPRLAAAQSEAHAVARSVSMISADESVLVKVVEDNQTNETWLFVIADNANFYRNVLVRPFGDEREFLTDENGRVNLGGVSVSTIEASKAEIVLPTAVFTLEPFTASTVPIGQTSLHSEFGDEIQVSLSDTGTARSIKVEVIKLSHRATDRPIRIAVRDLRSGRARMISPAESLANIPPGPISVEFFIFQ